MFQAQNLGNHKNPTSLRFKTPAIQQIQNVSNSKLHESKNQQSSSAWIKEIMRTTKRLARGAPGDSP
jgi:hypothetical protein